MPVIKIIDDVLAPDEKFVIKFKGKEPFRIVKLAKSQIKPIYGVPGKDIKTDVFKWDKSDDPRTFFFRFLVKREWDMWSECLIVFVIQGAQHSKTRDGWFTFLIVPRLFTTIEYNNFLQKSLWFAYNRIFYHKQREKYIAIEKHTAEKFRDTITRELGIPRNQYGAE